MGGQRAATAAKRRSSRASVTGVSARHSERVNEDSSSCHGRSRSARVSTSALVAPATVIRCSTIPSTITRPRSPGRWSIAGCHGPAGT